MTETLSATGPNERAIARYYQALEPFWHPVARLEDLGDEPTGVVLLERPLVLVRLDGELVALHGVCRHLGAALSLGQVIDGHTLRCRYHGWQYDSTGQCVRIPLRSAEEIPPMARVEKHRCEVRYGLVWVCLDPESDAEIPAYSEFSDERFWKGPLTVHADWAASMPRLVMAALDDTHFSWVHPGLLGVADQPELPERPTENAVTVDDAGLLTSRYRTHLPASPMSTGGGWRDDEIVTAPVEFRNLATANTMTNVLSGEEGTSITFNAFMPVRHNLTHTFTQLARDFDKGPESDERFERFNLEIKEQDRVIVESQRPWLLPPLTERRIMYVRPEDAPLVEYQKYLERIGVPQI